jgi:hypothetical protein
MKRLTPCLVLVLALALAGGAAAKEIESAKVCGASDCRTVTEHKALVALSRGGPPADPPDAAAFFRVQLTMRGDGERATFPVAIVPAARLLRDGNTADGYRWFHVPAGVVREYRRITRGLEPLPASKLRGLSPRKARVDEVVLPPEQPEPTTSSLAWPWIVSGLAGAAVLLLAVGRLRRRPR